MPLCPECERPMRGGRLRCSTCAERYRCNVCRAPRADRRAGMCLDCQDAAGAAGATRRTTDATPPGHAERLAVFAERAIRGEPLFPAHCAGPVRATAGPVRATTED